MNDLLLTLGHNSSAIHIEDGEIIAGYEEERLTGIKADSAFPINAISKLGRSEYDRILVSHWEPTGKVEKMGSKHWKPELLPTHDTLVSTGKAFTHHDAHAWSAMAFCDQDIPLGPDTWVIVADGFGHLGECVSIYRIRGHSIPSLIHRAHGYSSSLGLMYQYATAHLGMRMNQDEYKLLGYESQIDAVTKEMTDIIGLQTKGMIGRIMNPMLFDETDPMYRLTALTKTQVMWDEILEPLGRDPAKVAFVVQTILENVLAKLIMQFKMKNIILAGGVFMNVKANLRVLQATSGQVSIMPLCGDQGAALGLYKILNPDWNMPKHLFWGKRDLRNIHHKDITVITSRKTLIEVMTKALKKNLIVNLVRGDMEFGSRALCNTSTIALSTDDNVDYINHVNGRDTIMPMAPIILKEDAADVLEGSRRVVNSLEYMIIALPYRMMNPGMRGAAHNMPVSKTFTGRPQLIDKNDMVMDTVMRNTSRILINTSFNIHGMPICYDKDSIIKCVEYQMERDHENRIMTIVYTGD